MKGFFLWAGWATVCFLLAYAVTPEPVYTYAQEAEKWANDRCGQDQIRELRFHGNRQITLVCQDGLKHFWDRGR